MAASTRASPRNALGHGHGREGGQHRKLVAMALAGYRMTPEFEETLEKALGPDPTVGELLGIEPDIKAMLREINGKLDSLLQMRAVPID